MIGTVLIQVGLQCQFCISGSGHEDLPGLVEQTQVSMRELERLIEALQRNWLVRKYVNKTNPPPLRRWPAIAAPEDAPTKR